MTALLVLLPLATANMPARADTNLLSAFSTESIIRRDRTPDRWLAMDKLWHFAASFATVGAGYHLCADRLNIDDPVSTGASISGTLSLGVAKEFLDLAGTERHFSWKDLAIDAAGAALGYFVFIHKY